MARYLSQVIMLLVVLGIGAWWGIQVTEKNLQSLQGLQGAVSAVEWPTRLPIFSDSSQKPENSATRSAELAEEGGADSFGNQVTQALESTTRVALEGVTDSVQGAVGWAQDWVHGFSE